MSNIINKIRLSGTDYTLSATSSGGASAVEVTQAEYDALVSGGTVDPNTFYIITDGEMFNPSGKVDTSAFTEFSGSVETALSGKQDTLSAGTGIDITDNVISATGGGGGKAIEAGRGIDVASGTSAYTVSFNLPISAGTREYAIQEGYSTSAISYYDHAEGLNTYANGGSYAAHAEGYDTIASGGSSHAEGRHTIAGGVYAHAEGIGTSALTFASHAEGSDTKANSNYSHTEGCYTSASSVSNVSGIEVYDGYQARHAEGYKTLANNASTHAEGYSTIANNFGEHSSGVFNVSNSATTTYGDSGNTLFSVGNGTSNSARHNAFEIRQNGDIYLSLNGQDVKLQDQLGGGGSSYSAGTGIDITNDVISISLPISAGTGTNSIIENDANNVASATYSHAEGEITSAITSYAHAEGKATIARGAYSHAEGWQNTASGQTSHAEGKSTKAGGDRSHAEGWQTITKGSNSHAEGSSSCAFGTNSHAEGNSTSALTDDSHTEGKSTKTTNKSEHASGQYNNSVSASTTFGDSGNTLFSVGNGTADNARHNAFEIRQNGDIYCSDGTNDIKLQDTITATAANTTALGGLSLVKLTQAQYDALTTKDSNTLYVIIN